MSGHSHWATIKRKKEINDQKRGQMFSKLAKAISVAAKDGADPETNFKLRLLIDRGRQVNMPKESIQRAIQKGSGQGGAGGLEEIVYEGYGPLGVAIIIEAVTDNRNRTTAEIKNIFERGGGSLAAPGAVAFQFQKKGLLLVSKQTDVDEQVLQLIDLGAEDVEEVEDGIETYVLPGQLNQTKQALEKVGFKVKLFELISHPKMTVNVEDQEKLNKILKLIDSFDEHDDVQKVYTNLA